MNTWQVVIAAVLVAAVLGMTACRAHVVRRELGNLAAESDGEYLA